VNSAESYAHRVLQLDILATAKDFAKLLDHWPTDAFIE